MLKRILKSIARSLVRRQRRGRLKPPSGTGNFISRILRMAPKVLATAKVYWLAPEQSGRKFPSSGSIYAATAQFDEQKDEFFSIVLRFSAQKEQIVNGATSIVDEVEVGFLVPELVKSKLAPGKEFLITEGNRIVAQCQIQSVSLLRGSEAQSLT
ncbi:MAG: hypothetical protein N4J56_001725 [Chroococcidiopsis sp. SAG 2025]|uniref:hypothetical protein n=1 Tax=Chroococcidiopsis sp. SAG 2025 TaxID=171389 RepID=UPI0029371C49|nr:hypothetical protein [Chroococcidiopsis sp. SAG 2025]MDV2992071.1 hypothetical protein [Chroococcidiopsis sp. SAG 2025]